jgi:hypothetical protein
MDTIFQSGLTLLNRVHETIQKNDVRQAMDQLMFGLMDLRNRYPQENWLKFSKSFCLKHPLKEIVHRSPFTQRSFQQPRGYPGDAITLDFIYGSNVLPKDLNGTGWKIFQWEMATPGCASVRERRDILTAYINRIARGHRSARLLSIACGHLREAQQAETIREGLVAEFIALDQDQESLAIIEKEQANGVIKTVQGSVLALLKEQITFSDMDFVYAAGLFDYLPRATAAKLTSLMFTMLSPGGRLLIANFAPNLHNIGYMEAYMNWRLIYRDEFMVEQFAQEVPEEDIADLRLFRDSHKNLVFLEIQRK